MSSECVLTLPVITDTDIASACGLLQLPQEAFCGNAGTDPRQDVLKSLESIDVAACPGSGKTTLLVAKLAILGEKWRYATRGICVLSHTNVARNEIETKLGHTTAGRRLLSYPHYIGTIHGFVNEFMSLPWLRSRGYPVKIINTEICLKRRWNALSSSARSALKINEHGPSVLTIKTPDFGVGRIRWGKNSSLGENTKTYSGIREVCRASVSGGYFCHDEMFVWAGELMDQLPGAIAVIRDRFPLLFIDEAQDNSEEQSKILHRIFIDGSNPVLRQRFGDENQAIFDSMNSKEAHTDKFPIPSITKYLPNSHRFGQDIAALADPLGLKAYPTGLIGEGPKKKLLSSEVETAPHTLFLFDNSNTTKVLDAYGRLLVKTFSDQSLREGIFVAVGQVHHDKGDQHKPHYVGHYWPKYDAELSSPDPRPATFVQYVLAGIAQAKMRGESFPAVEKIAEGILRLAALAGGPTVLRPRQHFHRRIVELLRSSNTTSSRYDEVIDKFVVNREAPSKEMWNDQRRTIVLKIAETISSAPLSGPEVDSFLAWPEEPNLPPSPVEAESSRTNIYEFSEVGKKVSIRVGSIHSVKGQTHSATLILETFYYKHNLEALAPWFLGSRSGGVGTDAKQQSRLKLHYVAMTRPTHLLCLAMKASTFKEIDGVLNETLLQQLRKNGWDIKLV